MVKRSIKEAVAVVLPEAANKHAKVVNGVDSWSVTRGPQIIQIDGKSCQHEVAWPGIVEDDKAFQAPPKSKQAPAKQYPFSLDPFQQTAINCLEAGDELGAQRKWPGLKTPPRASIPSRAGYGSKAQ
jgi:superfamily II RNA helicase